MEKKNVSTESKDALSRSPHVAEDTKPSTDLSAAGAKHTWTDWTS